MTPTDISTAMEQPIMEADIRTALENSLRKEAMLLTAEPVSERSMTPADISTALEQSIMEADVRTALENSRKEATLLTAEPVSERSMTPTDTSTAMEGSSRREPNTEPISERTSEPISEQTFDISLLQELTELYETPLEQLMAACGQKEVVDFGELLDK
jgi:hypothetical protein